MEQNILASDANMGVDKTFLNTVNVDKISQANSGSKQMLTR